MSQKPLFGRSRTTAPRVVAIWTAVITCGFSTSLAALPDLIPDRHRLKRTVEVQRRAITAADCAFVESCVRGPGKRKLLLFDTAIANIGKADLVIGDPVARR